MKNMIKMGLVLVASLATFFALTYGYKHFHIIKYKMHAKSITQSITEKEYKYLCFVNSFSILTIEDTETVRVGKNILNINGLWGHLIPEHEKFVALFTNDMKVIEKLKTTTRDASPELFKSKDIRKSADYCEEIK